MSAPPRRSTAYQNAIKEATEWLETAQSSDEPTSHDLDPAATLPRLEFVSEAQVAAASKLLDMGGTGAGGAATHARLASLPQPSFRLARCAKDSRARKSDTAPPWPPGPMAMGRGKSRGLRRDPSGPPELCIFAGSSRQRSPLRPQSPSAVSLRLRQLFDSSSERILTVGGCRLMFVYLPESPRVESPP